MVSVEIVGAKFNLFLIYYSRYEKEKNWTADGLKIGAVPPLYPQRSRSPASYRLSSTPRSPPTTASRRARAHTQPAGRPAARRERASEREL